MNYSLRNILVLLLLSGLAVTAAYATPLAQIPQTGQTTSYASRDDGALQKGTAGTNAFGRFVQVDGEPCITDNQTGLTWAKNASIGFKISAGGDLINQPVYDNTDKTLNTLTWTQALTAVDKMNSAGIRLCGYHDWRLPNRNELRSLVNYGYASQKTWLETWSFMNVQEDFYWSSTTFAANTGNAWGVYMFGGHVYDDDKINYYYVWPVRGGQ